MNKLRQFLYGLLLILGDYKWEGVLSGDIRIATAELSKAPRIKVTQTTPLASAQLGVGKFALVHFLSLGN